MKMILSPGNDYFFVIVTYSTEENVYDIFYSSRLALSTMRQRFELTPNKQILYYRVCFNHMDAMAYRRLLQSFSNRTLESLIRKSFPNKENIAHKLSEMIGVGCA